MNKSQRRRVLMGLLVVLPVLLVAAGLWAWQRVLLGRGMAYQSSSLRFSGNGKYLLATLDTSVRGETRVAVWNADTGRLRALSLAGAVTVSADGEYLAELAQEQPLKLWRISDQKKLLEIPWDAGIGGFDFTPDSRRLVVFMAQASLDVWDLATQKKLLSLPMKEDAADPLFSPNGRTLAVTSLSGDEWTIRMFDLESGRAAFTLRQPVSGLIRPKLAFSPDGRACVTRVLEGENEVVQVRNLPGGEARTLYRGSPSRRHAADFSFSPDNRTLAIEFGPEPAVQLFDLASDRTVATLPLRRRARATSWSADGRRLTVTTTFEVVTAAAPGWAPLALTDETGRFQDGWTAPAGRHVAALREDGAVRLWTAAGEAVGLIRGEPPRDVKFSPDGKTLAVLNRRSVRLLSTESGQESPKLTLPYRGFGLAFSPKGDILAAGAWRGAHLWSADGSRFLRSLELPGHPGDIALFDLFTDIRASYAPDLRPPVIDVSDPLLPDTR